MKYALFIWCEGQYVRADEHTFGSHGAAVEFYKKTVCRDLAKTGVQFKIKRIQEVSQ